MAEQIDLVYPLYLDVPMLTSFVAALEDGIAYGADVTQTKDRRRTVSAEGEGKAGAGLPSMGILSTLLNFDLRGKITGDQAAGSGEEVKLVRRHTEASLFMRLRHALINDNRILQIRDISDLQQLKDAERDYLVEIRGQISRSPLNESLETVFRVLNMLGVDVSANASLQGQGGGGKSRGRGQQQRNMSLADHFQFGQEQQLGLQMLQRVREDLTQSKVLDVVMYPTTAEDLTIVIALALEFLPEGALDNLLSGDFSVLGKVTRLVEGSDEISMYQRTVFRNLDSDSFDSVFDGLRQSPAFNLSDSPSSIQAPAVQVMPLAIYV